MNLEVEHNGHKITYAENEDVWRCWGLDLEAKTLSALRTKINQWSARERRIGNVPVLILEHQGIAFQEAEATLLDADDKGVWVLIPQKARGHYQPAPAREKRSLESVIIDTPDNRAALAALAPLQQAARDAEQAVKDAKAAIPRSSREAFASLDRDTLGGRKGAR